LKSWIANLSKELGFSVSKGMLIDFLKKLGYSYRRIRKSLKHKPNEAEYEQKLSKLRSLIDLQKRGFIKIYYLDEAGFSQTPSVPYGWQEKKTPLSCPTLIGQRWNVLGIMSADNELYHSKTKHSINSEFVIQAINDFVNNPHRAPRSVLVMDNAKIHHSNEFKHQLARWQLEGVDIFYLPAYSPHLNKIETLWRKIRYEWLLPDDFVNWQAITQKIEQILQFFGEKYRIQFN
jgi:transposase